jgi:O-acetyl-ADP-ribose deacetylase (regulator of RNase III)
LDSGVSSFTIRLSLPGQKSVEFDGPADITKETTEAIVNAANSSLLGGGGVDGAIHRAGGPSILKECQQIVSKIVSLPPGKAVITGAGRLPAKFVIHTVGPRYRDGSRGEAKLLARAYRESLRLADEHGIQSLSFPSISTGAYGYPLQEAATIAVATIVEAIQSTSHVTQVRFVLFDSATLGAYVTSATALSECNSTYILEKRTQ